MTAVRRLVLVLLTGSLVAFPAGPAQAHAAYKDSSPPDEGTVSSPPSEVTAEFTEPLAEGSYLQVIDPCGRRVDGGDVAILGYEMSVSMNGAATGLYTVVYRAFSQLDPHVVDGEFSFTATSGPACSGEEPVESEKQDDSAAEEPPANDDPASSALSDRGSGEASGRGSDRSRSGGGSGDPSALASGDSVSDPSAQVDNILAATKTSAEDERSVWDGIQLQPFLAGLALALLIGAAGGKIYAGIMGPRA